VRIGRALYLCGGALAVSAAIAGYPGWNGVAIVGIGLMLVGVALLGLGVG
jgi:hypothetical protein